MGSTTKLIPYPEPTDLASGGADAIKALATDLDYTKVAQLDPTKVIASTPFASYPQGISSIVLSTANSAAGGWPSGASGQVWTFSSASDRAVQFFYRNSINDGGQVIFYRVLATSGLGPWTQISPAPQASGRVNVTLNNVNAYYAAVTFPAGRFTTPPQVTASATDTSTMIASTSSITATGCNIWIRNYTGSVTTATVAVAWIASGA